MVGPSIDSKGILGYLTVEVRYLTDPACPWSWAFEPAFRRLSWEFDGALAVRLVMGGLARRIEAGYADDETGIKAVDEPTGKLISHWLDVAAESGMPFDPRIWATNPLATTYPACMAVKAAAEQGPDAAERYLRRLREGIFCERRKLDHADSLAGLAGEAKVDAARFKVDLASNAITELFGADLEEVRNVPDEVRKAELMKTTEGKGRVPFPSLVFVGEEGQRHGVWGRHPYEDIRAAAIAAGAEPTNEGPMEPLDALARFGRCATRELVELAGRPEPLVLSELWAAAKEWRVKPTRVLTGTLWELA